MASIEESMAASKPTPEYVKVLERRVKELETENKQLRTPKKQNTAGIKRQRIETSLSGEKATNNTAVHAALKQLTKDVQSLALSYKLTSDEATHLDKLEATIKSSEDMVASLDSQRQSDEAKDSSVVYRLQEDLEESQQKAKQLEEHLTRSESRVAELEKRLGQGYYNTATTKILHLKVNPTSEAFRKKETDSRHSSKAPKMSTQTDYESVEGLQILNKRIKEVFQRQAKDYREAVAFLMGYKLDLQTTGSRSELLRLRSMYAENPNEDELVIRKDRDGSLHLLDTDFSKQIDDRVFTYLTACDSFPAFLSALTLHLFETRTFQEI